MPWRLSCELWFKPLINTAPCGRPQYRNALRRAPVGRPTAALHRSKEAATACPSIQVIRGIYILDIIVASQHPVGQRRQVLALRIGRVERVVGRGARLAQQRHLKRWSEQKRVCEGVAGIQGWSGAAPDLRSSVTYAVQVFERGRARGQAVAVRGRTQSMACVQPRTWRSAARAASSTMGGSPPL